jgi:hypothetical protein
VSLPDSVNAVPVVVSSPLFLDFGRFLLSHQHDIASLLSILIMNVGPNKATRLKWARRDAIRLVSQLSILILEHQPLRLSRIGSGRNSAITLKASF